MTPQTIAAPLRTDDFRRCLGEFGTGVTVITTEVDGVPYGMTSNSFASVSLDPPLVLWSIRRESTSFAAFEACTHFTVNILADDQVGLSQRFAKSGPGKFEGVAWHPGAGGAPVLAGSAATFECRRFRTDDGGDHLIMLGEVSACARHGRQPLLFSRGRYAVAVDHPDTRVFPEPDQRAPGEVDEQLLSLMLVRAYSAVATRLEEGRQTAGLGLTLMQARLLRAIQMFPDRTLEALLPEVLGEPEGAQALLSALEQMGLVSIDAVGRVRLTAAGVARLHVLVDHTREAERYLFRDIPPADMDTVNRVLARIIAAGQR